MYTNINIRAKKTVGESITDTILKSRGIVNTEEFFNPEQQELSSPFIFSDMENAVDIIKTAISNKDKILVWGDFDADGVTSTSIICKTLKTLSANYEYFLPDRQKLGHGLNSNELLRQKAKNHIKVLITVDCGISDLKEINLLKSLGVKIIITDHHEPPQILPNADCIINPLANNSLKADLDVKTIEKVSHMAGAGVALKLAYALLGEKHQNIKNEILALSAVGTIADIVPLLGENRIIAARGIALINDGCHRGIKRLFSKHLSDKVVTGEDVAFILAPRINAAGRLDSPFESIKLLLEDNLTVIDMIIEKLDMLNKVRQGLCEQIFNEALSMLNRPKDCIVLYNENWHMGIIGIVASKLVEKFKLPVFMITKDENQIFRSSVRGTDSYDISKILNLLSDCFIGFGGHSGAGGFSADSNLIDINTLKARIVDAVLQSKDESKISNCLNIDMELDASDINFELIDEISKMEPFGAENEKPVFLIKDAKLISQRQIGKDLNHTSYVISKDSKEFNCLYWKRNVLGIRTGENLDLVFHPEANFYDDERRIQLITECILNDKFQDNYFSELKIFDHRQKDNILDKVNDYVKNKNGDVKIWAATVKTKKSIQKYPSITENILQKPFQKEKTVMMFDYPSNQEQLAEVINIISPDNLHLMKSQFSKNPDDYITQVCGMIKYAANNKSGVIDIKQLALSSGLDETCIQVILEILEKIESIQIDDIDKISYIKAPRLELIHNDSMYEIFKDEFKRVCEFKDYFATSDVESIKSLCGF